MQIEDETNLDLLREIDSVEEVVAKIHIKMQFIRSFFKYAQESLVLTELNIRELTNKIAKNQQLYSNLIEPFNLINAIQDSNDTNSNNSRIPKDKSKAYSKQGISSELPISPAHEDQKDVSDNSTVWIIYLYILQTLLAYICLFYKADFINVIE